MENKEAQWRMNFRSVVYSMHVVDKVPLAKCKLVLLEVIEDLTRSIKEDEKNGSQKESAEEKKKPRSKGKKAQRVQDA